MKYKLIVIAGEEKITGEYENVVASIKDAETKANELMDKFIDDYPDTYIECLEFEECYLYPSKDFKVWVQDSCGDRCWKMAKIGTYCRTICHYLP